MKHSSSGRDESGFRPDRAETEVAESSAAPGGPPGAPGPDAPGPADETAQGAGRAPDRGHELPELVSGYRIVRRLGGGGMGDVYVAFDERLHRHVALKSIRPEQRLLPQARERFLREARLLSRLDHPCICSIHDYLESPAGDFLVLELIEGQELGQAIAGLKPAERLRIARDIADVLAAAHAAGIVHRDLKPANVMLTHAGEVKVLDFGIARLSAEAGASPAELDAPRDEPAGAPAGSASLFLTMRERAIVGSPAYMSPEQARGDPVGPASDMYSFGLLLQELLTGERCHEPGLTVMELIERARAADSRPVVGLERDLSALIERLQSKDSGLRPTASETAARLRWIQGKTARRTRRLAGAAALLVTVGATLKYTADLRSERTLAVEARADADGLIVFMLGDLRERLTGVGRLDVLDSVSDKALEYLSQLPEEAVDDEDLYHRSEVLRQIGMVRMAQGDLAGAEEAFSESLRLATDVVARHPERTRWLADLGASHYYVGYFHLERRELEGAREQFEIYREIADRLVALDGPEREWRLEQAYAHNNLGAVLEKSGDHAGAITEIEASIAIKRGLVEDDPEDLEGLRSLANGLSWLASTRLAAGDPIASEAASTEELSIRRRLVELDPLHAGERQLLASCHVVRGETRQMLVGHADAARTDFLAARGLMQELVELDPANMEWKRDLGVAWRLGAEALLAMDEPDPALEELDEALDILLEPVTREPGQAEWRWQLARLHVARARTWLLLWAWDEALVAAQDSCSALEPLLEGPTRTPAVRLVQADAHLARGAALEGLERSTDAREAWGQALSAVEPVAGEPDRPQAAKRQAIALLRLGRTAEALPVVRRLEGTTAFDEAIRGLAIASGIDLAEDP